MKTFGLAVVSAFIVTSLCCAGYVGWKAAQEESCNNRRGCVNAGGDPAQCHKRFHCEPDA